MNMDDIVKKKVDALRLYIFGNPTEEEKAAILKEYPPVKLQKIDYKGLVRAECNCSAHDITSPGAAHADDCPMFY